MVPRKELYQRTNRGKTHEFYFLWGVTRNFGDEFGSLFDVTSFGENLYLPTTNW